MLDLLEEFRGVLQALDAEGVEYAVCGGLAVSIHVRPRATVDIDLLVPRDALARAKRAEIHRSSKPDPETGDLLSIDLVLVTPELTEAWRTRQRLRWEHGQVSVVSRAGLVLMKRLRGSGQDLDDIRDLEATDGED